MVPEDVSDDGNRLQGRLDDAGLGLGDLNLALDQLDRGQQEGGKHAREGTGEPQGRQGKFLSTWT